MTINLPPTFRFGASTASYQIEGAVAEGNRGPSIWDTFCAEDGRIIDGSSGAVACDHYHRYAEDVALLKGLGVDGYRFSIAWSRIQPEGTGRANSEGLAFYDRLLDELLAAGIEPMATLYHWDLPQALEDEGGWLNRDTAERFAEYAALCGMRFGDRVTQWIPVNEPNVASLMGYALGMHAPGKTLMFDALPASHHLLLGHGLAAKALRATGAKSIGTANNHAPMWPASEEPGDVSAAGMFDDIWNNLFADPILLGEYPTGFAELMPGSSDDLADDLAVISGPLDFYGVNYYNPYLVAAPSADAEMPFAYREVEGYPMTDFNWPVVPAGLTEQLVHLRDRYPDLPPVVITESGCAYNTGPDAAGVVDDQPRIDYLASHLRAVGEAIAAGVDVRGYYTWSLIDNFEWSEGFTQRFGLVHVDYATQKRTPKKSYDWYAATITSTRAHGG
ncbi:MAG: GH1 family beta-glucosidase [Nocardioides sp.]|nr:GH1 family beta-glucosidase [Nocardioides sp.]